MSKGLILIADIHHTDEDQLDWGNGYIVDQEDILKFLKKD